MLQHLNFLFLSQIISICNIFQEENMYFGHLSVSNKLKLSLNFDFCVSLGQIYSMNMLSLFMHFPFEYIGKKLYKL